MVKFFLSISLHEFQKNSIVPINKLIAVVFQLAYLSTNILKASFKSELFTWEPISNTNRGTSFFFLTPYNRVFFIMTEFNAIFDYEQIQISLIETSKPND